MTGTGGSAIGPTDHAPFGSRRSLAIAGAVLVLAIAAGLFSRFSIEEELRRDEAIYAYAGQQLAAGTLPYVSILDPKTPLAATIAAAGVGAGRLAGIGDLEAIRGTFFVLSCLTVLAIFVTGRLLVGSSLAALAGVAAFTAFEGFAIDALAGPNAKTPGVLFGVLATALLLQRRWAWSGVAASSALLVWQPLGIYAVVAVLRAWFAGDGPDRRRALRRTGTGLVIPIVLVVGWFTAAGALGPLVEGALLLPLLGTQREGAPFLEHVAHIASIVRTGYGPGAPLLVAGVAVVLVAAAWRLATSRPGLAASARDPVLGVLMPPLIFFVAFSLVDFQGYPDVYPFLPYGALGIAIAADALLRRVGTDRRLVATGVGASAIAVVVVLTFVAYATDDRDRALVAQRRTAEAATRLIGPDGTVVSLGDPTPLVLMGRASPTRTIYLAAGVDAWVVEHTAGGFEGWIGEIVGAEPDLVFSDRWNGEIAQAMRARLADSFRVIRIHGTVAYVTPEVEERARQLDLGGSAP